MFEMDGTATTPPGDLVKDVTEASFMADVVDASKEVPVIVDFWAPWCGPCKQLGPALETAVAKKRGKVRMAKINVDENQMIAGQMRVQSIPAVFAFVDGQPVDGFMGNQTPAQIDEFVDRIAGMGGEDAGLAEAIEAANQMLDEGAAADAAQTFAAILGEEPEIPEAHAGMIRAYLAMDQLDQAKAFLAAVPEKIASNAAIAAVAAEIDLREASADAGEVGELRAALAANPDDLQARYDLGVALAAAGGNEEAIAALLEVFRRDREWNEGAAKEQLIKIFDMLGPKDALAQKGRRQLSSMIFA